MKADGIGLHDAHVGSKVMRPGRKYSEESYVSAGVWQCARADWQCHRCCMTLSRVAPNRRLCSKETAEVGCKSWQLEGSFWLSAVVKG